MSQLVTPTGIKGCASHVALAAPFVPVARPGTKGPPPFVPAWRSRLRNRDNRDFPTGIFFSSACGRLSIPYLMTALRAGSGGQRYRDRCRRRRPPRSRCRCSVEQFLRSKRLEVGRPKVLVSRPRPRTGSGPCFAARSRRPAQPKLNRWNYRKFR